MSSSRLWRSSSLSSYDPRLLDVVTRVLDEELSEARKRAVARIVQELGVCPVKFCEVCKTEIVDKGSVCPRCRVDLALGVVKK